MSDSTTPQDDAAMSHASTGSVDEPIDVEELIRELHHIAGSEQHDPDVRRVACVAESALARLRAWVNELQMNVAEREAAECGLGEIEGVYPETAATLRAFLERHK